MPPKAELQRIRTDEDRLVVMPDAGDVYAQAVLTAPGTPGVYTVWCNLGAYYVGKAKNIHKRLQSHDRRREFCAFALRIDWVEIPLEQIHSWERSRIRELHPYANPYPVGSTLADKGKSDALFAEFFDLLLDEARERRRQK